MKKNFWQMLKTSPYLQRSLVLDNDHLLVQVPKRNGILWKRISHKEFGIVWDRIEEKMLVEFVESRCPIFRATTPLSRGKPKSKGHGKLSIHFAADQETIETVFRMIISANQLNLYGAVANMCEECESLHDRSRQPDMMMRQSIFLSEIKKEIFWIVMTQHIKTFYCSEMKSGLKVFHRQTE